MSDTFEQSNLKGYFSDEYSEIGETALERGKFYLKHNVYLAEIQTLVNGVDLTPKMDHHLYNAVDRHKYLMGLVDLNFKGKYSIEEEEAKNEEDIDLEDSEGESKNSNKGDENPKASE